MGRYIRRIQEEAYAHIEERATRDDGTEIDWSAVGSAAANQALGSYLGAGNPERAIEGTVSALDVGDAGYNTTTDTRL